MTDDKTSDNRNTGSAGNTAEPIAKGVHVRLVGEDGNCFSIMGRVIKALRRAGREDLVKPFLEEATSGNYIHLLATCLKYCECD